MNYNHKITPMHRVLDALIYTAFVVVFVTTCRLIADALAQFIYR